MSELKIGDWVRNSKNGIYKITYIEGDAYYDNNGYIGCDEYNPIRQWQPKEGEWCWYGFELVQVIDKHPNHVKICRQKSPTYEEIPQEYLKPFIGQLPEIVYEDIHYDDDK
jgi:hypothetical protein